MSDRYQTELDEFNNQFFHYKDKRIILYGIGRYTATIVNGLREYQFVGLMDKNPENIGKDFFGIPVLSLKQAEQVGDLIIINTSETYWEVIYNRIKNIKLPVYFKNGEIAHERNQIGLNNSFVNLSLNGLYEKCEKTEVLSFDFFDTLFVRRVCNPGDVFQLLQMEFADEWKYSDDYTTTRNIAKKNIGENYTLDSLYDEMSRITGFTSNLLNKIKESEMELERLLLCPRGEVVEAFKTEQKRSEIHIVSDMYLPKSFYRTELNEVGIVIDDDHIHISCEEDADKKTGSIWSLINNIIDSKKILHVGDDKKADIEIPREYGIDVYQTPSPAELLRCSTLGKLYPEIVDIYSSTILGTVISKLFNNPYTLKNREARVDIKNEYDMGYNVFGPVILTFLLWLVEEGQKEDINTFVFMSRDGYFLKKDFDLLCELLGYKNNSKYIGISRQLAMTASIETDEDLISFLKMPYSGNVVELFEDRIGIRVESDGDQSLTSIIKKEKERIDGTVSRIRSNYLSYLEKEKLNNKCGLVDLGYYGNNQRYLNKLLGLKMTGFYFNANTSSKNENTSCQKMRACFQKEDDPEGKNSEILKKMMFLESFLTAPYGMVKEISGDGSFITAAPKKNQMCFDQKETINNGVSSFIRDYLETFGSFRLKPNKIFIDHFYGCCFDGSIHYSDEIKSCFYNDNAMMNRLESSLFY